MDSEALRDLLTALPEWASRLQQIAVNKFPADHGATGPVDAVNPGGEGSSPPPRKVERPTSIPEDAVPNKYESGTKKMNQKPGSTKAKFSSITGPDIYYDGDSQACLFECWTSLNAKRGALRKEMMMIRRKKVMTLPSVNYGYGDSDDDLEAEDSSEEKEETEEDRLQREEEERQRIKEEENRKRDEKKGKLLEFIDGCLDKAAKACENAAYLWLKGEGCMGHVVFITQRMMEAVHRVNAELAPEETLGDEAKVEDEGFGEDSEDYNHAGHTSEEELPHKPAGDQYRRGRFRSSTRPVEVAG
jgi:hypothetical protein